MKFTKAAFAIFGAALCGGLVSVWFFSSIGSDDDYGMPSRSVGDAAGSGGDVSVAAKMKRIEEVPADLSYYEEDVSREREEEPSDESDAQEQLTEDEKRKAAAEERWDRAIENCEALQDTETKPSKDDVAEFKAAFDALDEDDKLQQIARANILLLDSSVECLEAILLDVNEPEDVLSSVFHDICNRDESIKLPIFKAIAQLEAHPMADDAKEILAVYE